VGDGWSCSSGRPGADRKVGADRSTRQGFWTVPGGPPGGYVYAKAKRKVRPNGSVCRKDRSWTFIQPHHPVRQSPGLL
jgi:hypothetical protein